MQSLSDILMNDISISRALCAATPDMRSHDLIESLQTITCDPCYRNCVEWLGMPWGHPVAPPTPARVRGFSPSEMTLLNHSDVAYDFVRTLKECGYQWLLVQEHSVERKIPRNSTPTPSRAFATHCFICCVPRPTAIAIGARVCGPTTAGNLPPRHGDSDARLLNDAVQPGPAAGPGGVCADWPSCRISLPRSRADCRCLDGKSLELNAAFRCQGQMLDKGKVSSARTCTDGITADVTRGSTEACSRWDARIARIR
jgi:hypothetical protein